MLPSFFSLFICDILLPICYMSLYTPNLSFLVFNYDIFIDISLKANEIKAKIQVHATQIGRN